MRISVRMFFERTYLEDSSPERNRFYDTNKFRLSLVFLKGKLESLVPNVTAERRDELHKLISLWLVRFRRPLSLPEHATEFRDIFDYIFKGQYIPPTAKIIMQNVLLLSAEGKQRVMESLRLLLEEGILPSLGGDVWSQGGISIFGILVYWLDDEFVLHERLLAALPFSSVSHTADELEKAAKLACAEFGIGKFVEAAGDVLPIDKICDFIHVTAPPLTRPWLLLHLLEFFA
ncbi:hypothetical protein CYMTET_18297 [Cymbomonas tetramitiformis]|uniref:Uncharacterized protein n=1 Tax=Cymbomonas tetramitiformis TaxID=36881 RepID=A0AAE0G8Q5_9CHLO|nr:hypothetical protein CYMTET_18297 [Cymbomonas tetramitiformis]